MKWAEIIILRSPVRSAKMRLSNFKDLIDNVVGQAKQEQILVFCREKLDTDICLVLCHNDEKTETGGSPLGLRLTTALKELGLVRHTIWIEMEGCSAQKTVLRPVYF